MSFRLSAVSCLSLLFVVLNASGPALAAQEDLSNWKLPPVPIPKDNPQTDAKVALGHQLVFDPRLSKNDSMGCVACHLFAAGGAAWTARAFGHGGELGRWAPSWDNAAYYTSLFWDGRADSLEQQSGLLPGHMGPVTSPGEMASSPEEVVSNLNAIPAYKKQFRSVFGTDATAENVAKAIASFQRTLISRKSPFQRYVSGDSKALSAAARRGFDLFRTKALCSTCHTPPLLTDNLFHDVSVPQVGPMKEDNGRFDVTKNPDDKGKFKTPSLYNSASLAFFMHDGAFSTLSQVIDHYNKGGNPQNKHQDPLIMPLKLTDQEKADLIAFLESLTDKSLDQISRPALP